MAHKEGKGFTGMKHTLNTRNKLSLIRKGRRNVLNEGEKMIFQKEIDKLKEQIKEKREKRLILRKAGEKGQTLDNYQLEAIEEAKLQVYEELSKKVEAVIDECEVYELFEGNKAGKFIRKSELKTKLAEIELGEK